MKSQCKTCEMFGQCGFEAYVPMIILSCPKYKRGKNTHNADCYLVVENKRGRKSQGIVNVAPVISMESDQKVIKRIKEILSSFPKEFRASQLKQAYEKQYNQKLVFTATMRKSVCKPWKYGVLVNKCHNKNST